MDRDLPLAGRSEHETRIAETANVSDRRALPSVLVLLQLSAACQVVLGVFPGVVLSVTESGDFLCNARMMRVSSRPKDGADHHDVNGRLIYIKGIASYVELGTSHTGEYIMFFDHDSSHRLTPREMEVLQLVAEGQSAKQVALLLHIAPCTVERHIENVRLKTRTRNRAHMVAVVIQNGMLAHAA